LKLSIEYIHEYSPRYSGFAKIDAIKTFQPLLPRLS